MRGVLPRVIADTADPSVAPRLPDVAPLAVGSHVGVPLHRSDGSLYGTLCAFSSDVVADATPNDLARLRLAAEWLGQRLAKVAREKARQ